MADSPYSDTPIMECDFETRSVLDVRKVGAWRYSEHPSTEVLCLSYGLHGEPKKLWTPGLPFPDEIKRHYEAGGVFEAHNAQFEMAIFYNVLYRRGVIDFMPARWVDTMAACAYRGLPLGLDAVGDVLNLDVRKDKRGKYLLQQLSKPRKPRKKEREEFEAQGLKEEDWPVLWREDWDLLEELYGYCITDSDSEEELSNTIGFLPVPEQRLWILDQKINRRGVRVDLDMVHAMSETVAWQAEKLNAELYEITGGVVTGGGEVERITKWLRDNDVYVDDLTADTVEVWIDRLADDEDEQAQRCRRVLEIRQQVSKTSTKKADKILECVCDDGRLRGLLQYHGAGTGRWSGRLVQPQNFPRGELEDMADALGISEAEAMERLAAIIKKDAELGARGDLIGINFGEPLNVLPTALRGTFIASEGCKLRVADFSAIEAVVTSWVAGEDWKLDMFRAIQRGEMVPTAYGDTDDIYCATATLILDRLIRKKENKPERQTYGKVPELAFGYQGGLGAWYNFDKRPSIDDAEIEYIKDSWRERHPATKSLWYGLNDAAVAAVSNPGRRFSYSCISYQCVRDAAGLWMVCILPNGRWLWYYEPRIETVNFGYGPKQQVVYQGRDNKRGGAWGIVRGYGGLFTENVVQAISRDAMAEAMVRVELADYPIILTVHDEIVADVPEDHGSQDEFETIMAEVPAWLTDCPISVDGWAGTRYRK